MARRGRERRPHRPARRAREDPCRRRGRGAGCDRPATPQRLRSGEEARHRKPQLAARETSECLRAGPPGPSARSAARRRGTVSRPHSAPRALRHPVGNERGDRRDSERSSSTPIATGRAPAGSRTPGQASAVRMKRVTQGLATRLGQVGLRPVEAAPPGHERPARHRLAARAAMLAGTTRCRRRRHDDVGREGSASGPSGVASARRSRCRTASGSRSRREPTRGRASRNRGGRGEGSCAPAPTAVALHQSSPRRPGARTRRFASSAEQGLRVRRDHVDDDQRAASALRMAPRTARACVHPCSSRPAAAGPSRATAQGLGAHALALAFDDAALAQRLATIRSVIGTAASARARRRAVGDDHRARGQDEREVAGKVGTSSFFISINH